MHPLDNVIWRALTTRQVQFADACDRARRFEKDVTSLSAFAEPTGEGYDSLASLIGVGGTAALFLENPYEPREGWDVVGGAPLLQMVCENGVASPAPSSRAAKILELGPADSPEMVDLATLTKPGPFGSRTHELGTYLGIRNDGKLVAMAGERLKVPGFTEVSAVCTHPEHTGKGYARLLMNELMQRVRERKEIPFLHVRSANTRAVDIYRRLGFRIRAELSFVVVRRAA